MSKAIPYLIDDIEASGQKLNPLPLTSNLFKEEWLQKLLYNHPDILPVDHIGGEYGPLAPIGREIANIDNLFISPNGLITIVETKLWRNPEAHRTVVAQILDYAKTLSEWSYSELEKAVQGYIQRAEGKAKSIYQIVKSISDRDISDEIEFQQKVQSGLENGKFALLIVGDKIYPAATQLSEIIQSAPHMQFSLGFIELKCYQLDKKSNWPLVVVPNLVAKTKEVTRAVVKVVYEEKKPEIEITTPSEEKSSTGKTTRSEFLASLPTDLKDSFDHYITGWVRDGYTVYWGTVGFSLRVLMNGKLKTIMDAYPDYISIYQEKRLPKDNLPKDSHDKYKSELMTSSLLGSAYASDRRYVYYKDLLKEDIELLLKCTDNWVKELSIHNGGN